MATKVKEPVQEPQDTEPIPITIVRPTTKPALEVEIIRSSSRPQLTDPILEAHMELEERKKKAYQEAKLLALSKPELIKVVTEVATKAGVDPKAFQSSKGGKEFIPKHNAELKVLNKEHFEKLKKAKELRMKRID
ncbi:hypothetical protein Tco_0262057 [Tanacetum coccineum]